MVKPKMVNILIAYTINIDNIGDRAIASTTIELIKRKIPYANITLLTVDSVKFKRLLAGVSGERVHFQNIIPNSPAKYSSQWWVDLIPRKIFLRNLNYRLFLDKRFFNSADVYFSIGADIYTDSYGIPVFSFESLSFAKKRGALTMISAASIGPFCNAYFEKKWAKELRKVDLITVRETMSLEYLKQLGVEENVRLVADPAFLLSPDPNGVMPLDEYKTNTVIGLNMSGLIARYGTSEEQYLEIFKYFTEGLLSDKKNIVLLIPHNSGTRKYQNDYLVCRSLYDGLSNKERIVLIDDDYSASQLKYIIGQCSYFFGARTHSTIASLSSLVPTISIAYSMKAYGINKDIFGHLDYVISIKEIDKNKLMEKYELLRNNHDTIVGQLKRRIPEIKLLSERNGDYLAELLKEYKSA